MDFVTEEGDHAQQFVLGLLPFLPHMLEVSPYLLPGSFYEFVDFLDGLVPVFGGVVETILVLLDVLKDGLGRVAMNGHTVLLSRHDLLLHLVQ